MMNMNSCKLLSVLLFFCDGCTQTAISTGTIEDPATKSSLTFTASKGSLTETINADALLTIRLRDSDMRIHHEKSRWIVESPTEHWQIAFSHVSVGLLEPAGLVLDALLAIGRSGDDVAHSMSSTDYNNVQILKRSTPMIVRVSYGHWMRLRGTVTFYPVAPSTHNSVSSP